MDNVNEFDGLRIHCHHNAFFSFATAWIFEKRARRLRKYLKTLAFFGLVAPVFVGGMAISFGTKFKYLPFIITLAIILSLFQLIISLWSLVEKWDDEFAYSSESTSSNYSISNKYKELGVNPPSDISEFKIKVSLLNLENNIRTESDYKHNIGEKEKRIGHRAALRQFQMQCVGCKKIPTSMKPSDCDMCGNF